MGVELNRDLDRLLESLDQLISVIRLKKSRHVLDADRVCAHLLELLCVVRKVLGGINRTGRIADRRLNMTVFLLGSVYSGLEVAGIVERVEDTDNVDTVCNRLLDEILDDVVGIVTVAEDILSAEEHLELGVLYISADLAESFPRILIEEAQAGVECSAAPCLKGVITDLIKLAEDREHFVGGHTGRNQGLMRVAQDRFGNFYLSHLYYSSMNQFENYLNIDRNTPAATAEPMTPATFGPIACISRKFAGLAF